MLRKNLFTTLILVALLLLGSSLLDSAQAQLGNWSYKTPLCQGGVPIQIQLIRTQFNYPDSIEPPPTSMWAVNMEGGAFHATYSGGSWSNWTPYIVDGDLGMGLDAVKNDDGEHVMTAWTGVRYALNPTQTEWRVPHPSTMPLYWDRAIVHDCAFFCDTSGHYAACSTKYFMAVVDTVRNGAQSVLGNPGIYRWQGAPLNTYARVDEAGAFSTAHRYDSFFRDMGNPNVVYAFRNQVGSDPGRLVRFKGLYDHSSPSFTVINNIVPSTGTLNSIAGFNQWFDGDMVYSYLLAKWRDVSASQNKWGVFISTDLDSETPEFTTAIDVTEYLSEPDFYDWEMTEVRAGGGIVGRPEEGGGHTLWMTLGITGNSQIGDGVICLHVNSGGTITSDNLINDSLKCYDSRMFCPDWNHCNDDTMFIFYGTHKHGIYRLMYHADDDYEWDPPVRNRSFPARASSPEWNRSTSSSPSTPGISIPSTFRICSSTAILQKPAMRWEYSLPPVFVWALV